MTQVELAKKAEISRPYLARMETGKQRIYLHHLLKLDKALGYPQGYLIGKVTHFNVCTLKGCLEATGEKW